METKQPSSSPIYDPHSPIYDSHSPIYDPQKKRSIYTVLSAEARKAIARKRNNENILLTLHSKGEYKQSLP